MRNIIFIFVVLFLVGCASSPSKQYQANVKGVALYGYLSKSDNGSFYFSKFQQKSGVGSWVRLNDGKPMWETNCTESGDRWKVYSCKNSEDLFIYGHAYYEDEYIDAYEEALNRIEGGNERIQSEITKLNQPFVKFKAASDSYKTKVSSAHNKVKFDIAVEDRTGLYDNSINFHAWGNKLSISSPIQPDVLASVDDADFNQMVLKYKRALHSKVREIKATNTMNVSCKYNGKSKFHVASIKCPSSIPMTQSKVIAKPVITSVTYEWIIPSLLKGSDEYISYIFNGNSVSVTNNTNQFISVSSVSFYHNDIIATNEGINYDLPPQSVKKVVSIRNMRINKEAITFYNVTKQSAQDTKLSYGIAIKYNLGNAESRTLYDSFNFSLYELIK